MTDQTAPPPEPLNRGVFLYPALLGLLLAGMSLVTSWNAVASALQAASDVYVQHFPQQAERPFLAEFDYLPLEDWVIDLCRAFALLLDYGLGIIAVLLIRPRSMGTDLNAGLAAGTVTVFALLVGGLVQALVLASVLVPQLPDLHLLCQGTFPPPEIKGQAAADELLRKYPDLKAVPADERSKLMYGKLVADQTLGTADALWRFAEPAGVIASRLLLQTLLAGIIWRHTRHRGLTLMWYFVWIFPLAYTSRLLLNPSTWEQLLISDVRPELALSMVWLPVAFVATLMRWPLLAIVTTYAALLLLHDFLLHARPTWCLAMPGVLFLGALGLLVQFLRRGRVEEEAAGN